MVCVGGEDGEVVCVRGEGWGVWYMLGSGQAKGRGVASLIKKQ